MPKEDRAELLAIPVVAAAVLVFGLLFVAVVVGAWAWWLFLLALAAVASIGAVLYARGDRHPAPESAPRTAPPAEPDGSYRVLVIAHGSCTAGTFGDALVGRAGGRKLEALVVAPALGSRLARWTGDEGSYGEAQAHLDSTLAALAAIGVEAGGHVGSHDPIQAADDGLREFPADEIVFAMRADGDEKWLEEGVVETARDRYEVPVTHLVVEAPR